ncbi:MAG: hypothetical protein Q9166_002239 [cf. Caloplaca sp. 2 TL-2023]
MSSTMTATVHPSVSNLTVPTTQNTAPVLSFNCLYTHDLRRKAKRWQDGVLRFHTFNKRVMVYDVPRNFIGDTHWREPQVIQDGDELELEKGVLIQVGEQVERTETDLSELLEKRKPKLASGGAGDTPRDIPVTFHTPAEIQPADAPYSTVDRSMPAIFSQLRPKSLNALLGRSRGPVGRAALPSKSPAEQRREKENVSNDIERSPKRRRLQHPTNANATVSSPLLRKIDHVSEPAARVRASNAAAGAPGTILDPATAIKKSSHPGLSEPSKGEQETSSNRQRTNRYKIHKEGNICTLDCAQVSKVAYSNHASPKRKAQITRLDELEITLQSRRDHKSRLGSSRNQEGKSVYAAQDRSLSKEGTVAQPRTKNVFIEDEPRPENLLRVAAKKPRRKLMYRDLLPQKAPPPQIVQTSNNNRKNSVSSTSSSQDGLHHKPRSPLNDRQGAQQDPLQSGLSNRSQDAGRIHLNEDEGEFFYTPDRVLVPEDNHDSTFPESIFLSQSSAHDNASESPIAPLKPDSHPPPDVNHKSTIPESISLWQSSSGEPSVKPLEPPQNRVNPPTASLDDEPIRTSTQAARTLSEMDSLLLQHPHVSPKPAARQPQLRLENDTVTDPRPPQSRAEVIKAALPPPLEPPSRSLQRSLSDLTAPIQPDLVHKRTHSLLKSYSNSFAPPNASKVPQPPRPPPPPPIQIHSTNLYASNIDSIPDSRPGSAKEQTIEPWSREAFDLFGFDGAEKRVGTCNGVKGFEQHRGAERGEDGWLVGSQGFV